MANIKIVSNGNCTGALIDGVYVGWGVKQMNFTASGEGGKQKASLDLLGLDVENLHFITGDEAKERFGELEKSICGE